MRRHDFFARARSLCAEGWLPAWLRVDQRRRERQRTGATPLVSVEPVRAPANRFVAVPPRP